MTARKRAPHESQAQYHAALKFESTIAKYRQRLFWDSNTQGQFMQGFEDLQPLRHRRNKLAMHINHAVHDQERAG